MEFNSARSRKISSLESFKFKSPEKTLSIRTSKKIRIGFLDNIKYFLNFKKKNSKVDLLNRVYENINKKLDIIYLIKKLNDLEKFKLLLFDKDQNQLFNSLPKPEIKNELVDQMKSSKKNQSDFINRWESLFDVYETKKMKGKGKKKKAKEALSLLRKKSNKTEIDKNLIEIFSLKLANSPTDLDTEKGEKSEKVFLEDI